jgi:hypothetical protein
VVDWRIVVGNEESEIFCDIIEVSDSMALPIYRLHAGIHPP